jgi:hypothetical protein
LQSKVRIRLLYAIARRSCPRILAYRHIPI